jgi:hypothetical protein
VRQSFAAFGGHGHPATGGPVMKLWLIAAGILLIASEAQAISRYQTLRMGCEEVQDVVRQEGAVILRWHSFRDPSLPLYGRYVSDRRFCDLGEVTKFESVPTADHRYCTVKQCVRPDIEDYRRWYND